LRSISNNLKPRFFVETIRADANHDAAVGEHKAGCVEHRRVPLSMPVYSIKSFREVQTRVRTFHLT
jgi:hypothetical protein